MAKPVIEALEMVDVEHQTRKRIGWLFNMPVQRLIKRSTVQKTSQGVLPCHANQPLPKLEVCNGKAYIFGEEFEI
ncbi:hypothetical protein D3C80_1585260 [compost metagenome]